ncbi:polysaccharide biosynthesis C-terminal domain-containing protein, partial [Blautia producta]
GKAFKSSIISSVSVISNIILNAVLIFGLSGFPGMGIAGAALATVAARIIEVLWCILEASKKNRVKLRRINFRTKDSTLCRKFWKHTF